MKEKELREHATCSLCGCKLLASGIPLFYRVTIERFGIDLYAVQRQSGFGLMMGAVLAMHMGPNEDMAQPIMDPVVLTVCENCSTGTHCVAELAEAGA